MNVEKNYFIDVFRGIIDGIMNENFENKYFTERDIVCEVQKCMTEIIKKRNKIDKEFIVYNDYPIEPGVNRSVCADLVVVEWCKYKKIRDAYIDNKAKMKDILNGEIDTEVEFLAEFKFEPSNRRSVDICTHKTPVVTPWNVVKKDIYRINCFVKGVHSISYPDPKNKTEYNSKIRAKTAVALLIDEDRYHCDKYDEKLLNEWISKLEWNTERTCISKSKWCNNYSDNKSILWTEISA